MRSVSRILTKSFKNKSTFHVNDDNTARLGLFWHLVVSSGRAVTIDPSTGVRGSLSRGVRIWINHVILFSGAPTSLSHRSFLFRAAALPKKSFKRLGYAD